jgi:hypothetical protein
MILRRRVALNGQQLDELDDRIVISGIEDRNGTEQITAQDMIGLAGQRVTEVRRVTKDVAVRFRIWATKDQMAAREAVLEKVNAWAYSAYGGGYLTMSHKPGRRLRVLLAQAPGAGEIYNWTDEFTVLFRAYTVPYWEDSAETSTFSASSTGGEFYLTVPGNTVTVPTVTVANMSGATISGVNLTMGGKTMSFSNLGLGGGQSLVIDHEDTGKIYYLRARIGDTSVLRRRTGADDFVMAPGSNKIAFAASRAVRVTVAVRGRYL